MTSEQEFLLVYSPRDPSAPWWARWADARLAHVDIWQPIGDSCFLVVRPQFDLLQVSLETEADLFRIPDATVQRVTAQRPLGVAMFPVGVKTCVSVAKAMLGIRAPWLLTPRQLFDYVHLKGWRV